MDPCLSLSRSPSRKIEEVLGNAKTRERQRGFRPSRLAASGSGKSSDVMRLGSAQFLVSEALGTCHGRASTRSQGSVSWSSLRIHRA